MFAKGKYLRHYSMVDSQIIYLCILLLVPPQRVMPPILSQIDFCILQSFHSHLPQEHSPYSSLFVRISSPIFGQYFEDQRICAEKTISYMFTLQRGENMYEGIMYLSIQYSYNTCSTSAYCILPENVQQTVFVWLLFSLQGNKCQIFIEGNRKPISVRRHLFN